MLLKLLKIILGVIAVVFLVVFAGSFFLPKTYYLERSIEIKAPADTVFPLIAELRNWPQWSPWYEMDPEMRVTYGVATTGVGGGYSWLGEKAGTGSIEITEFNPPTHISFQMKFKGWEDSPSNSSFIFTPNGYSHSLAWSFSGEFSGNPIKRYLGLMFEKLVGGEYEKGLANLKALAEAD